MSINKVLSVELYEGQSIVHDGQRAVVAYKTEMIGLPPMIHLAVAGIDKLLTVNYGWGDEIVLWDEDYVSETEPF